MAVLLAVQTARIGCFATVARMKFFVIVEAYTSGFLGLHFCLSEALDWKR
ncbi:hypothetical protein HanPSC8_Chr10g0435431 [Helianthus annuus]|nr:hypothetical protein HanPSC8_Chr10g0435431 [Helianthus annuus]